MVGLRDVLVVAPAGSFHHSQHHHHLHLHHDPTAAVAYTTTSSALLSPAEHPIIPLLAAAQYLGDDRWQNNPPIQIQPPPNPNPNASSSSYLRKPMPVPMLDPGILNTAASFGGGGVGVGLGGDCGGGVGSSSSGAASTCQDCGNQAKKDCIHRRCRTCCKSRGFDCSTHLRSTWVPAARRRERHLSSASASASAAPLGRSSSSSAAAAAAAAASTAKRQRTAATASHTSTSNTSFDTTSSHQDASFRESLPGQVTAPAVFKCVRVTSVDDDGQDEYAYQAMVSIGGHVFKGFLYDQGVVADEGVGGGVGDTTNDSGANNMPNISELHLGGGGSGGGNSDVYGGGGGFGGFVGGTAYGNPKN